MKNQQGITLIALIITIIIMLILAGVVINLTIGENGIFKMAKTAAKEYEIASIKEQIMTDIYSKQVENMGNISDDTLKKILEKYGTLSEEENLMDKTLTTDKGNHEIKVSDIFNGTTVKDETKDPQKPGENPPEDPVIADKSGASIPNISKIAQKTYVTWDLNEEGTEYVINDTQTTPPLDWYDYENGKWANIKTTNETEGLEAYWVWIPRYEYIVPTSETATQIEVKFIPTSKMEPDEGYTIHPAFTNEGNGGFGELDGIWVAKFEVVSSTPTADCGGGNDSNLKAQVIPGKPSWRHIQSSNMFAVCRRLTRAGEVLAGSTVDSHMMKNIEWGAVAILSQSKYGIFNPKSSTGANGDETYQIWNNPSSRYITGSVGGSENDYLVTAVNAYNTQNGPKASTTGTVYGVYDMAGGGYDLVAGCLSGEEESNFGVALGDTQYVDIYTNTSDSYSDSMGAKVGDATKETQGWNQDRSYFPYSASPVFVRGGFSNSRELAGVFEYYCSKPWDEYKDAGQDCFRVVLIP